MQKSGLLFGAIWRSVSVFCIGMICLPAIADSSSPMLAAYYDRQMAILEGTTYFWKGTETPRPLPFQAEKVGVGRNDFYVLTVEKQLLRFERDPQHSAEIASDVVDFGAGHTGVLISTGTGELWWIARTSGSKQKISANVASVAVGDGANYYITRTGALFVKGKAHRGQYGDGRLKPTDRFVQTASNVKQITAHTGHAILLTKTGDVMGTGGNIYGPVGEHGLGDKATQWRKIMSGARAIATGSTHSTAIRQDGTLMSWGSEYGRFPVPVMINVHAVAAGSGTTIALKNDGSLWQWEPGQKPRQHNLSK